MNATTTKQIAYQELTLVVRPLNEECDAQGNSTWEPDPLWYWTVYRFDNGAIQVPYATGYDEFYSSLEELYKAIYDEVVQVVEDGTIHYVDIRTFRMSVLESKRAYGKDAIPSNVIEMIRY